MEKVLKEQKWLNKGNSKSFFDVVKELRKTSLPQKLREAREVQKSSKSTQNGDFRSK